jgi:predicted Zn-dependent protease
MKDKWVKLRAEGAMAIRWKGIAEDRNQTLTAFVVSAVEAAIVGKIDQATLDQHLRAIRADSNAAYEATTIEEARRHIDIMRKRIAVLRGIER